MPGSSAAIFELDGDVFEVGTPAQPTRDRGEVASHAAVHRVLVALSQRDGRAIAALESLGLGCDDVELALRTGVLGVIQRSRPGSRLDVVEYVDLGGLASS
jgi:hypothetical protein